MEQPEWTKHNRTMDGRTTLLTLKLTQRYPLLAEWYREIRLRDEKMLMVPNPRLISSRLCKHVKTER
jgi:hypothetical protein